MVGKELIYLIGIDECEICCIYRSFSARSDSLCRQVNAGCPTRPEFQLDVVMQM